MYGMASIGNTQPMSSYMLQVSDDTPSWYRAGIYSSLENGAVDANGSSLYGARFYNWQRGVDPNAKGGSYGVDVFNNVGSMYNGEGRGFYVLNQLN